MKGFFLRHQPPVRPLAAIIGGAGAATIVAILALASNVGPVLWVMAPFGATCVLLFASPQAPLSQPMNIICGNTVSAIVGVACVYIDPGQFWLAGLAVGLSITLMMLLRIVHPPAGATALLAYLTGAGWFFILFPVLAGSILLVAFATLWHRFTGGGYPLQPPI
ncbi:MAG: HPP family protein [Proteobacteria bacterium]|nr:HPP family protein [Pseudomonadota bacterium]